MTPSDAAQNLAHDAEQQRQRILNQPAGPGLDSEIQRVVFGSEVFPCTDSIHPAGNHCPIWRYRVRSDEEPDHISAEPGVPPYSTEAGAAWTMLDRFWAVTVERCNSTSPEVVVTIGARDGREWSASGTQSEMPLCAARCALLATLEGRSR